MMDVSMLLLVAVGGLIALDGTSVGQFMLSRPFIASIIGGWIAGDAQAGAAMGVVLEAFALTVLPVGAARYSEGGPAALTAGALVATHGMSGYTVLTAVVFFLVWGWASGETVRLLRRMNSHLLSAEDRPLTAGLLQRRQGVAIAYDFGRGAGLVLAGVLVLTGALRVAGVAWGLDPRVSMLVIQALVAALLAGSLALFPGRRRLFAMGAAGGLIILLARQ
jgi:hypothetical protein